MFPHPHPELRYPIAAGIEDELRDARAVLRARETPPGSSLIINTRILYKSSSMDPALFYSRSMHLPILRGNLASGAAGKIRNENPRRAESYLFDIRRVNFDAKHPSFAA